MSLSPGRPPRLPWSFPHSTLCVLRFARGFPRVSRGFPTLCARRAELPHVPQCTHSSRQATTSPATFPTLSPGRPTPLPLFSHALSAARGAIHSLRRLSSWFPRLLTSRGRSTQPVQPHPNRWQCQHLTRDPRGCTLALPRCPIGCVTISAVTRHSCTLARASPYVVWT